MKKFQTCKRCQFRFALDKTQCPSCRKWHIPSTKADAFDGSVLLSEVGEDYVHKYQTGPWDECWDGGIPVASTTLLGGSPGAGKSTVSLQLADAIAERTKREIIFVSSEQSLGDIRSRTNQMGLRHANLLRMVPLRDGFGGDLGDVLLTRKPVAIILDSIQGMGYTLEQEVELARNFKDYAVRLKAPVILISHVTKDGELAGLNELQHEVDVCITLHLYDDAMPDSPRIMHTLKNRFGKAQVSLYFAMTHKGLIPYDMPEESSEEEDTGDD